MMLLIIFLIVLLIINPFLFLAFILLIGGIIGLSFYIDKKQTENVMSAKVICETQVTRKKYQHSGFSIGSNGHARSYWSSKNEPAYTEVLFEVTYTNWNVRKIKAIKGTQKYEKLINIANYSEPIEKTSDVQNSVSVNRIEIKKNQLSQGVYIIGKDIPKGKYDLFLVYGSGSVHKYIDETTLLGANNYFQWMGNKYDYEQKQCIGIDCKDGEYLHIKGNIIVEIKKSKQVIIDL